MCPLSQLFKYSAVHSFNNFYKPDEDAQIISQLSPVDPDRRHQDARTERFHGIGDWVLEAETFRKWIGGEGGADKVVFFSGNPGGVRHIRGKWKGARKKRI